MIVAADIALTRLISFIIDQLQDEGDEKTIEELAAEADAMDARRAAVMEKIKGH